LRHNNYVFEIFLVRTLTLDSSEEDVLNMEDHEVGPNVYTLSKRRCKLNLAVPRCNK